MTIEIKIKLKGLKGKKFLLSKEEKDILSGMFKLTLSQIDIIDKGKINKYLSYLEDARKEMDVNQKVINAAYYLKEISLHPYSFEITDVQVS